MSLSMAHTAPCHTEYVAGDRHARSRLYAYRFYVSLLMAHTPRAIHDMWQGIIKNNVTSGRLKEKYAVRRGEAGARVTLMHHLLRYKKFERQSTIYKHGLWPLT
jgi:hypothetical protein